MCNLCDHEIGEIWNNLLPNQIFRTPDTQKGVDFYLERIENDQLTINPQNTSISKAAFAVTLHYLRANRHDEHNPCEIRSSNDPASAGPLCLTARGANNNIRCINYILPILAQHHIVGINPRRPNTTWLLQIKTA